MRGNYEQLLIDAMGSDDEVNVFSAQYRVRPYAEAVTPLAELPVVRGGQEINRFRLYLGTGFSPALP